jgi:Ca2+/H+ antiporter
MMDSVAAAVSSSTYILSLLNLCASGSRSQASVLLALGFVVANITHGQGRTNLLVGTVHLALLATYFFRDLRALSTVRGSAVVNKSMRGGCL